MVASHAPDLPSRRDSVVRDHYHLPNSMSLETFPKEILVPSSASIRHIVDVFRIEIHLQPFTLDNEAIATSFVFEGVHLPRDTQAWAHRSFTFPRNPTDGYIDGSIYLRHVHNPVDVTCI